MYKVIKDFSFSTVNFKAGDIIQPGQFEADQIFMWESVGFIVNLNPKPAEKPAKDPAVKKPLKEK
jgi:hypothetical protein